MEYRNTFLDNALRTSPLFIMDSILKGTFLLPLITLSWDNLWEITFFYTIYTVGFLCAIIVFLWPKPMLKAANRMLASALALGFSYYFNCWYVEEELKDGNMQEHIWMTISKPPYNFFCNLLLQLAISFIFNCLKVEILTTLLNPLGKNALDILKKVRGGTYPVLLLPMLLRCIYVSPKVLVLAPAFSCLFMYVEYIALTIIYLPQEVQWMWYNFQAIRERVRNFGIQAIVENYWTRLRVPSVLRIFWVMRTVYLVHYFSIMHYYNYSSFDNTKTIHIKYTTLTSSLIKEPIASMYNASAFHNNTFLQNYETKASTLDANSTVINELIEVFEDTLTNSCDTIVALMGMTSVVSYVSHFIGLLLSWYVESNSEEDRNLGTMTAILFFVLALQTGLTSMTPDYRLSRLYRNFCLLLTAILHFIHGMVNPLLMNLAASQHYTPQKHLRPLSMCLFLILFPMWLLYVLWSGQYLSTWMLAVTAFCIEVIIKVVISLIIYTLFIIDRYREVFWESLDDYVYYVKACGNTIEFIFGIFLFCNGAWIMFFEAGGTIRAIMMCIHAYFNIWIQAKEGWKTFIKRRTAAKKINSLPEASHSQLVKFSDVCAICYQEMANAKITRCNHYFHSVCLRKWLYVQDTCPMCHKEIYNKKPPTQTTGTHQNELNGNANGVPRVPLPRRMDVVENHDHVQ